MPLPRWVEPQLSKLVERAPTGPARSSEQAIRMAGSFAAKDGLCGAIAFSRTGDPALGDFEDAVILKTFGEVDTGLLSV